MQGIAGLPMQPGCLFAVFLVSMCEQDEAVLEALAAPCM